MGMEHGYMRWMRGTVGKPKDSPGCMAMISLVSFSMININYCLITRSISNDWNIFSYKSKVIISNLMQIVITER